VERIADRPGGYDETMCGCYSLTPTRQSIIDEFQVRLGDDVDRLNVFERYNIAPTQPVAVVAPQVQGRVLTAMRWGIIPQWMKPKQDGKPPAGWINARSETTADKPAFRGAYKYRRCIVPADGFYEWAKTDGSKQPYLIRPADNGLMAFAGLWETWCPPDGSELATVTILTTRPNDMMAEIHDRMPVVLSPDDYERWMTTEPEKTRGLADLLRPAPDGTLYKTPVTRHVNNARHDDPACWDDGMLF